MVLESWASAHRLQGKGHNLRFRTVAWFFVPALAGDSFVPVNFFMNSSVVLASHSVPRLQSFLVRRAASLFDSMVYDKCWIVLRTWVVSSNFEQYYFVHFVPKISSCNLACIIGKQMPVKLSVAGLFLASESLVPRANTDVIGLPLWSNHLLIRLLCGIGCTVSIS